MKALLFVAATAFAATTAHAEALQVDPAKSVVQWTGTKLVGSHTGKLSIKSGSVEIKDAKPVSGEVIVDMLSLTNEDLTDKEKNGKLVGHLKSPDFFDVEKHPTAKLVISKSEALAGGVYKLTGTLSIKDKTQPISFTAKETVEKDGKLVRADLTFNRADFDVRYGSGRFFDNLGDKVINDEVQLSVTVFLKDDGKKTASK